MKRFSFHCFWAGFSSPNRSSSKKRKDFFTSDEFEKIAIVEKKISSHQRGRVRYQGTYWYARVDQNICILPNTRVFVTSQDGMTLVVKPLPSLRKFGNKNIEAESPNLRAIGGQVVDGNSSYHL